MWGLALLLLVPACSYINHLGGQSTVIPFPRIVCRVLLMPVLIGASSRLAGLPIDNCSAIILMSVAGFALWAIPAWGEQFMAINCEDHRDYSKYHFITAICDKYCGVSPLTQLTRFQCREWGTVYGTVRGLFLYPLFIAIGLYLTPWAFIIGLYCIFQGTVYRFSPDVLHAEYIMGSLIGGAWAAIFILYRIN